MSIIKRFFRSAVIDGVFVIEPQQIASAKEGPAWAHISAQHHYSDSVCGECGASGAICGPRLFALCAIYRSKDLMRVQGHDEIMCWLLSSQLFHSLESASQSVDDFNPNRFLVNLTSENIEFFLVHHIEPSGERELQARRLDMSVRYGSHPTFNLAPLR